MQSILSFDSINLGKEVVGMQKNKVADFRFKNRPGIACALIRKSGEDRIVYQRNVCEWFFQVLFRDP